MRDKIWKIAVEMNYAPNIAARALRSGTKKEEKMYYIHVLMTRTDESQFDPFFSELLHVIESEIHGNTCILSKIWYMPMLSDDLKCRRENLDRVISDMYEGVDHEGDGLIIIGKCNHRALQKLERRYRSIVSVNRNSTNYEVDEITCDGKKIAAIAVEHLIELGHTDIGYVGACHNEARYRGYINTLAEHNLDQIPQYILETKQTEAEGYRAMEKFLETEECPTAIYCANDITAIGMLKCLQKHRKRYYTPSIIASDDIEEAQFSKPMLTTVRLPKTEMGKFAVSILLDRIRGGHTSIVRLELEGKLVKRESCGRVDEMYYNDYVI